MPNESPSDIQTARAASRASRLAELLKPEEADTERLVFKADAPET